MGSGGDWGADKGGALFTGGVDALSAFVSGTQACLARSSGFAKKLEIWLLVLKLGNFTTLYERN